MFLYHIHDWQNAVLAPWRVVAEAAHAQAVYGSHNPFTPAPVMDMDRALAAGTEMFERMTRQFGKPAFGLNTVKFRNQDLTIEEEIVAKKPFCNLLHFKRSSTHPEVAAKLLTDPKMLIVAPISGHHATLLRGTVEAMLPEHDVYITDWLDAKTVPLSKGKFDLEDNITYVMDFLRHIGPRAHVMAVCQPVVPVLCAVALLADMDDPAQPDTMTLMGGPVDTRRNHTAVTDLAEHRSIEWFRNTVIQVVPFYYPGAYRMVYPGFIQIQSFIAMNLDRHIDAQFKMFQNLARGDDESADSSKKFYDEYLSVMDITSEFFLQTIERVFQRYELPNGTFHWNGRLVKPQSIKRTALLTIEGELDDISAPGQTLQAHNLCSGLPDNMKESQLIIGVGHYGIFNGRKWRNIVQPAIANFVRAHGGNVASSSGAAPHQAA